VEGCFGEGGGEPCRQLVGGPSNQGNIHPRGGGGFFKGKKRCEIIGGGGEVYGCDACGYPVTERKGCAFAM